VLGVAVAGSGLAGVGNGIETVAARTAMQEAVDEKWMALMMSFNESLAMFVPGAGIVLGGAITELTNARVAWVTAGAGALAMAAAVLIVLRPTGRAHAIPAEQPARDGPSRRASPSSAAPPV
jgi:MFS family permease